MNSRTSGTKLVPVSAEIEADLRDDLKALAKEGDRSFSAEVRRALRWYVLAETSVSRIHHTIPKPEDAA